MAIREGILALLVEEPKYGYQLKREFETLTGDAWTVNVGQVYTTLQRLERDGLIEAVDVTDDQQRHRLTPAGSAEVRSWMDTPVERHPGTRDVLTIKLLLAIASPTIDAHEVLATQRGSTMTSLQDLQHLRAETDETDVAWVLQLDRLALQAEAELRWLDRIEDRLAAWEATDSPRISTDRDSDPSLEGVRHDG